VLAEPSYIGKELPMRRKPTDEATVDREYEEARVRLRERRKAELARSRAPIPKVETVRRVNPLDTGDPLGIGSAGTRKKVQR
jgi:hypothetical protein